MNWLKHRLQDDYESVLADAMAIVICIMLVMVTMAVFNAVGHKPEFKTETCRNEWGHRIECTG